jgi:F-type H+-transporting ATPase subunit gamma
MASLKYIRTHIKSIEGIQKITLAMKLISSAKLSQNKSFLTFSKDYALGLKNILNLLLQAVWFGKEDIPEFFDPFFKEEERQKRLIIIFTPSRGLCGGFAAGFLKAYEQIKNPSDALIIFGIKGIKFFKSDNFNIEKRPELLTDKKKYEFSDFISLGQYIVAGLKEKRYTHINILSAQFKNVMVHPVHLNQIFPFAFDMPKSKNSPSHIPLIEEKTELFFESVLLRYITSQLFAFFTESLVSEYAERMLVMDNATKSTKTILNNLKLDYNRKRQQLITNELIEIISASNALI